MQRGCWHRRKTSEIYRVRGLRIAARSSVCSMDTTASPNARRDRRDRITVDLRGLGLRLHQLSAARGTTVAALTRGTVAALLEAHAAESTPALVTEDPTYGGRTLKTTLRIPVTQ